MNPKTKGTIRVSLMIFLFFMIPSVLIDLGAFMANEVKMPLDALMLIEAGIYLPLAVFITWATEPERH